MHTGGEPFEEQVQLFANAGMVVGLFASGLSNLIFMPVRGHMLSLTLEGLMSSQQDLATYAGVFYHKFFLRVSEMRGCGPGGGPPGSSTIPQQDRRPPGNRGPSLSVPGFRELYPLRNVSGGHFSTRKEPRSHLLHHSCYTVPLESFKREFEVVFREAFPFVDEGARARYGGGDTNTSAGVEEGKRRSSQEFYFPDAAFAEYGVRNPADALASSTREQVARRQRAWTSDISRIAVAEIADILQGRELV